MAAALGIHCAATAASSGSEERRLASQCHGFFRAGEAGERRLAAVAEADRATLIRRVSFDLTGLPPTPQEIDEFRQRPIAECIRKGRGSFARLSRYGERMAFRWLDAARYADTNGYQIDGDREMWRWRDWVIEAFNRNMPFNQFIVEQLAGDLLPQPDTGSADCDGIQPQPSRQLRRRSCAGRVRGGVCR